MYSTLLALLVGLSRTSPGTWARFILLQFNVLTSHDVYKKQHIRVASAITNSSRRSLDWCFLLRVAAAAATALAATATSVYFAVDKLGEIDNKVLVLARSKREVEKGLGFDRFHAQLHKRDAINT